MQSSSVGTSTGLPLDPMVGVRKLDLSQLCFSLNFLFSYVHSQFPSVFPFANLFSIIPFLIC